MADTPGSPIDSFFVALGFDVDDEKVDDFKAKTEDLRQTILNVGLAAAGIAASIGLVIDRFIATNEVMSKTSEAAEALGTSAVELDNYNRLTEMAGGNIDKMQAALGRLVDEGGQANGALGEIAKKMETLSRPQQIELGAKLGLDPHLTDELSQGYAHYLDMLNAARAANPFSERDYENARRVSDLWAKIAALFTSASMPLRILVAQLSNIIIEVEQAILRFLQPGDTSMWVSAMSYISTAIADVWEWIKLLVSAGEGLFNFFDQYRYVALALAGVLALLVPWHTLLIGGLVALGAALALVADDVRAYLQGQQSYIGYLEQKYPIIHDIIMWIGGAVRWVGEQFDWLWGLATRVWGGILDILTPVWDQMRAFVVDHMPQIRALAEQGYGLLLKGLQAVGDLIPVITKFWDDNQEAILSVVRALAPLIEAWLAYKLAAWAANDGIISKNQESWIRTAIWVASMVKTLMGLKDSVDSIFGGIGEAFDWLGRKVSRAASFLGLTLPGELGVDVHGNLHDSSQPVTLDASDLPGQRASEAGAAGGSIRDGLSSALSQMPSVNDLLNVSGMGRSLGAPAPVTNGGDTASVVNHISAPITITTPDPIAAGNEVRDHLDSVVRDTTRNGMSKVGL